MTLKDHLVEDARNWWKWLSTWCFAAIGVLQTAQASLALLSPDVLATKVPFTASLSWQALINGVSIFLALAGPYLRAVRQTKAPAPEQPPAFADTVQEKA